MKMKVIAEVDLIDVLDHALTGSGRYFYTDTDSVSVNRLRQFAIHGCKCYFCGVEADRALVTVDNGGGIHLDLYAGDVPMNRDHILPASKGGKNDVWNMRPACAPCNSRRGNELTEEDTNLRQFNYRWAQWHNRLWMRKDKNSGWLKIAIAKSWRLLTKVVSERTKYQMSKIAAKIFLDFL